MFNRRNSGQSILEYAVLLGVVVAAVLIMQVFVKRGFQGNLKESADKMGEQFSAGGTTVLNKRVMAVDQTIVDATATDATVASFLPSGITPAEAVNTLQQDTYSVNQRTGGDMTMTTKSSTDSAKQEKTRWGDYADESAADLSGEYAR
ncbi:MAG: hypothetical protein HZC15_07140 [Candidatus Omnitrophica bacterium]|nr:hypothetical protein [Candidatus Omnitrophota bacterium]